MSNNAHQWPPQNDQQNASSSSIRDAQYLLNSYPFASATPSTHVARHLSNLASVAIPPSYSHPSYHLPQNYNNNNNNSSMYATNFHPPQQHNAYASRPQDRQYWDNYRGVSLHHLNAQPLRANACYPAPLSNWNTNSHQQSSFQTPPFAHSVLQNAVPYHPYPTPPPPPAMSSASSSLAGALGPLTHSSPPRTHQPSESPQFFNNFLTSTHRELTSTPASSSKQLPTTPQSARSTSSTVTSVPQSSPDPLSVSSPMTATPTTTPKKRRTLEVLIETPSKRFHSESKLDHFQRSTTPQTSSTIARPESSLKKQVYVEIASPSKSLTAPRTPHRNNKDGWMPGSGGDLGGYGSEDEHEYVQRRETYLANGVRSSGKRTGDRDDRAPLEKLQALLEDIFEAEDNVPPNADRDDLPQEFFSTLSPDPSRPLLHASLIRKLSTTISKVARPTKRVRLSHWENGGGTPRRTGGVAEIESANLLRVLKLLERSVRLGENLEPFGDVPRREVMSAEDGVASATDAKKSKSKKKLAAERSKSPQGREEDKTNIRESKQDGEESGMEAELEEESFAKLERDLEFARDSVLAADCCLALLNSDRLPKQLYSEELINVCLSAMKNLLSKVIYPFVESPSADPREMPPLLQHVVNRHFVKPLHTFDIAPHRGLVKELFQALSSALPRVTGLINAEVVAMSDTIIIQAVYIAIGPFFIVEASEGDSKSKKDGSASHLIQAVLGSSAMRGLRLDALSLVRSIFANYEDQRQWIIEEILSSLIKLSEVKQKAGHFRLRDGRSIRTVSALLLQLVQTSSHNVRVESLRIARARHQNATLRRQDVGLGDSGEPFLDELYEEECRLYASGLDAPAKAARTIVLFLTQRSGKSKTSKNANETEYRAIFDNFISDLLTVLFWPEWPAAGLVLNIIIKFMITSLDDVKTVSQNDNNAQKSMALDHLGVIAGRLRQCMQKYGRIADKNNTAGSDLKTVEEIVQARDTKGFEQLATAHGEITTHLCQRASEDQTCESARELTAVMWGQELANVLRQCQNILGEFSNEEGGRDKKAYMFGTRLKRALTEVWRDAPTDVFDTPTQAEVARVDHLSEEIGTIQSLKNAFDPILNVILLALDAPPVFMRTKALRALSQILAVDPSILTNSNVRRAIENHLLDSSPAVRDAAVELIGKYMIDSPSVAGDYFQKIAERIADTGLGVRKRVIKLLRSFYLVTNDLSKKVEICSKLVLRMLDEDDTVKDLAVKTLEELWFSNVADMIAQSDQAQSERLRLLSRVTVIMTVCGNFKDRQSPLDDILHKIVSAKEGAETSTLLARFGEVVDVMIDGLVDASDFPGFSTVNCIRTIYLFAAAYPPIISSAKASTLLPYLKSPTTAEEQVTSDYILKIFRISLPHMSKTSAKFGGELQRILQPMVIKPNASAGLSALQETVACLCAVVKYLTHDFVRLVALLKSCSGRVNQFINRPKDATLNPQDLRALTMVVYIVALLGEHCNFEQIRAGHPELNKDFDAINRGPIDRYIYHCILRLYEKYTDSALRGRLLQCLGFLFKGHPTLMTLDSSATMMDAIFASSDEDERARLLRLLQEFLVSESTKHSVMEKESVKVNGRGKMQAGNINMEELVGNTHGFAESGVSSAVVQRYLSQIHDAALSPNPVIHSAAVDILTFTVKQGLAHPLQSFPVIIALETSPNAMLSARANSLHSVLHHKHASLLNAGYVSAARASYDYLARLEKKSPQGYRLHPSLTATLHRWYSLVREKRAVRQDFLKSIVKVFDIEHTNNVPQDDLYFTRYMAENLSALEYKTLEEVLTIIKYLTSVLSTSGTHIVEVLCPSQLLTQLHSRDESNPNCDSNPQHPFPSSATVDINDSSRVGLIRRSILVGIILLLKGYLKTVYGLSEEKCLKFVPGKKSAVGDRPAIRKKLAPLSFERLPFALKPILTSQDAEEQQRQFLALWGEEGASAEPEEGEWE